MREMRIYCDAKVDDQEKQKYTYSKQTPTKYHELNIFECMAVVHLSDTNERSSLKSNSTVFTISLFIF